MFDYSTRACNGLEGKIWFTEVLYGETEELMGNDEIDQQLAVCVFY
jgi:hypothetical protein